MPQVACCSAYLHADGHTNCPTMLISTALASTCAVHCRSLRIGTSSCFRSTQRSENRKLAEAVEDAATRVAATEVLHVLRSWFLAPGTTASECGMQYPYSSHALSDHRLCGGQCQTRCCPDIHPSPCSPPTVPSLLLPHLQRCQVPARTCRR